MITQKLEGGYMNTVSQDGLVVTKHYEFQPRHPVDPAQRFTRERVALTHFGGIAAPALLGVSHLTTHQEFVEGVQARELAESGDRTIFEESGTLLRKIHSPVARPAVYLRDYFEKRAVASITKAQPVLNEIKHTVVDFDIDWADVFERGTTRVHRDFWFTNIIKNGKPPVAVDWEWAGIGSPYEDFAQVAISVFSRYPWGQEAFWQGYGETPHQGNINQYIKLRILDKLATTPLEHFKKDTPDKYYARITHLLKTL